MVLTSRGALWNCVDVGFSEKMQRAASTEGERQKASSKVEPTALIPCECPTYSVFMERKTAYVFLPTI